MVRSLIKVAVDLLCTAYVNVPNRLKSVHSRLCTPPTLIATDYSCVLKTRGTRVTVGEPGRPE